MTTAFPLAWPNGWPRTAASARADGRGRFQRRGRGSWSFAAARDALYEELDRLGSPPHLTVLSSDFQLNQRGEPSKALGRPADQGVAIYFRLTNKPYVMACDRFDRAEENMRSLTLAIEAMRQLKRHGGGVMMERAFAGFAALSAPSAGERSWRDVLGLSRVPQANIARATIENAYRALALKHHPDVGGAPGAMAELNNARDRALKEIGS